MNKLRKNDIFKSKKVIDYLESRELKSNTLKFIIDDNEYVMIRPSGTEPKIKVYIIVNDTSEPKATMRLDLLKDKVLEELK